MSRLRVAIVTPGTFAIPSGKSSSVELVATEVGERLKDHVLIDIFGKKTKGQPASEVLGSIRFLRPPARPYIRQVAKALRKVRPDVIQVENRPRFARYLKKQCPHTPVVLSLHSTTFISRPHISPATLRSCLRTADTIVVNSEFLRQRVVAADASIAGKIVVNHLGVDTNRFVSRWSEEERARREEQLARLGLAGKKIILYVGRFIPRKGVHHLLAAMPAIAAIVPDVCLLLVGGASYGSNRLTPYVRKLHRQASVVNGHVRFLPFVSHDRIPECFRLADVVVVPSDAREAFGLVNVEAMACGVPVVATAAGGMKEIIEHGVSGLLIDPDRPVEQLVAGVCALLENPDYARTLGENGIRRVRETFTWEHASDRLLQLYNRLSGPGA